MKKRIFHGKTILCYPVLCKWEGLAISESQRNSRLAGVRILIARSEYDIDRAQPMPAGYNAQGKGPLLF